MHTNRQIHVPVRAQVYTHKYTHVHIDTHTHTYSCSYTNISEKLVLPKRLFLDDCVLMYRFKNSFKISSPTLFRICETEPCIPIFCITSFMFMNLISLHWILPAEILL